MKTVRADAQRNRQRLLEVARRSFSAGGDKVTLEAIAREAGMGIGTLYRHFPTREALVEAVYRAELSPALRQRRRTPGRPQPRRRAARLDGPVRRLRGH